MFADLVERHNLMLLLGSYWMSVLLSEPIARCLLCFLCGYTRSRDGVSFFEAAFIGLPVLTDVVQTLVLLRRHGRKEEDKLAVMNQRPCCFGCLLCPLVNCTYGRISSCRTDLACATCNFFHDFFMIILVVQLFPKTHEDNNRACSLLNTGRQLFEEKIIMICSDFPVWSSSRS